MQALFKKKFVDKTQNEWPLEDGNFEQMPKKYRLIGKEEFDQKGYICSCIIVSYRAR
jgi:hypothetical protein